MRAFTLPNARVFGPLFLLAHVSTPRAQRHWHDLTQKKVEVLAAGGGGAALGDATPPVPPSMSGRSGAKIYHSVRSSHRRKLAQSPYNQVRAEPVGQSSHGVATPLSLPPFARASYTPEG